VAKYQVSALFRKAATAVWPRSSASSQAVLPSCMGVLRNTHTPTHNMEIAIKISKKKKRSETVLKYEETCIFDDHETRFFSHFLFFFKEKITHTVPVPHLTLLMHLWKRIMNELRDIILECSTSSITILEHLQKCAKHSSTRAQCSRAQVIQRREEILFFLRSTYSPRFTPPDNIFARVRFSHTLLHNFLHYSWPPCPPLLSKGPPQLRCGRKPRQLEVLSSHAAIHEETEGREKCQ